MNSTRLASILRLSALPLFAAGSLASLHAALPALDGFSYTAGDSLIGSIDGDGNGGTGWTSRWSGSGTATVIATASGISYAAGDGASYGSGNALTFSGGSTQNAATRPFLAASDTSGADVYFSYIVRVTNGATTGTIPSGSFMSVGILDSSTAIATDNFAVIASSKLGARTNNATVSINTSLQYATTYLVVARLGGWDGDSYTSTTVWLNPDHDDIANASISATSTSASGGADGFRGIVFRTNALGSDVYTYDDLRVGASWDSVVLASAIPEPASAAVAAGLGALGFGLVSRRRSRSPRA